MGEARKLVEEAFFMRVHGERPPGAPWDRPEAETWSDWDIRAEAFLRAQDDYHYCEKISGLDGRPCLKTRRCADGYCEREHAAHNDHGDADETPRHTGS